MPNKLASQDAMTDTCISSLWTLLPDDLLLCIFKCLSPKKVLDASQVCIHWHRVALDELLWKDLFYRYFKISRRIPIAPGMVSWLSEFKRLIYHTPLVESEVLHEHKDQVLHVSFAHNGKMFATTSKDGFIKVWNAVFPCSLKYYMDMKEYKWKYTQFSQFNSNDTLLLVSGVHFGSHSTSGEIAVFSFESEFTLQCRIINKPYDIFGAWYNNSYLFSGNLYWRGNFSSLSVLWLNKASQALESEHESVVTCLYQFLNQNASSIRTILVATCPKTKKITDKSVGSVTDAVVSSLIEQKHPISDSSSMDCSEDVNVGDELFEIDGTIICDQCGRKFEIDYDSCCANHIPHPKSVYLDTKSFQSGVAIDEDFCDKYLIFTMGEKTYTPHQIGIKKITAEKAKEIIGRLKHREERNAAQNTIEDTLHQHADNDDHVDHVDHLIELHGHIIGMCLSPDHRFLYVNSRQWPKGYEITDPLTPPPISQEIDIHVIDLETLKEVGSILRSHKAFTPNDECFFIFLDVSSQYIASGAEDKHGHLWDRHYGICLQKFPHTDVVNSVAFNPCDPEMLVTVSDDNLIKIWRSQNREQEVRSLKLLEQKPVACLA